MDQWWLLGKDRTPIGPVSEALVLQGILAGRVPGDSLVCEVGGSSWQMIRELGPFATAFAKLRIDGPTMVDPPGLIPEPSSHHHQIEENPRAALRSFEDTNERTVTDAEPIPSEVPPARPSSAPLTRFEEGATESTVVDEPLDLSDG